MPLYDYRCPACGTTHESQQRSSTSPCPNCGLSARRNWAFRRGNQAFKPHFNHAVGQYVESDAQFREALKRGGGEAESSYAPVYPGDIAPRDDTDILETQARTWHDLKAKGDPRAFEH